MIKQILSRSLAAFLAVLMVVTCAGLSVFAADSDETAEPEEDLALTTALAEDGTAAANKSKLEKIKELLDANSYDEYTLLHTGAEPGSDDVLIDGADFNEAKTNATVFTDRYLGSDTDVVLISETGDVTYDFEVKDTGLYNISITYAPIVKYDGDGDGQPDLVGNGAVIERALLLDGTYPFTQSRYIEMTRVWNEEPKGETNERGFVLDNSGSEIKPNKVEEPEWRTVIASDSTGYVTEPFQYYIEAGQHTLTLAEVQEVVAIRSIRIYYDDTLLTYSDYLRQNDAKTDTAAGSEIVKVEAETPYRTSTNIIYPTYDRSSAASSPQSAYNIYLNTIGGTKWQTVGQWIQWTVSVPADGYYTITPRFNQSFAEGMYVTRTIAIDGEIPFREARSLRFKYDDDWQLKPLTDGVEVNGEERALKFYMTKGEHLIEMSVSLGTMAEVLTEVEGSLAKINEYYLQILMLTGSDPDEYRDYKFMRLIPDTIKGLGAES